MTTSAIALCIVCQALLVAGQLLLKHAVSVPRRSRRPRRDFSLGIACLTAWFFIWLGLMAKWDLSKLYPFEGLNPAIMAVAAWFFLKEKLPATAWIGLALVCAGIVVVAGS